jgi:DNA-binding NarL/FixJ family response regulator
MNRHFFIAPAEINSPRWQQAFPQAKQFETVPAEIKAGDCCWCYCAEINSFNELIKNIPTGVVIIAMTAKESFAEARQLLALGASGYVHYLAVAQVLTSVADAVASGSMWLGADLMRQLVLSSAKLFEAIEHNESKSAMVEPPEFNQLLSKLTDRERAVAETAAQGKSNKEIARELDITERTVKAHLGSVFEKCQIRDRLQLVLIMSGKHFQNH